VTETALARPAARPLRDCVVVVTPRSFGADAPELRADLEAEVGEARYRPGPLGELELAEAVADADGLLAGLDEVTENVFSRSPRLCVVARYGVGVDRVDLDAARRHGVTITVTPGANANAVAELTVAFLLCLARSLVAGRDRARAGEWPALRGIELEGRTLGLLGCGRIGSLVAGKARALGMHVIAYDPFLESCPAELVDLDTLVTSSDFLSLHAPLTPGTRGMVDRRLLARMKEGSALVNTARGELVETSELVWALDHGPLRAAAVDVLDAEPPPAGHPLLGRDDVIVTPHMGPHTAEATTAMGRMALADLLAVLSGEAPAHPVHEEGA
jgi:phosphoglycerate dehydrogenase-like enzyme